VLLFHSNVLLATGSLLITEIFKAVNMTTSYFFSRSNFTESRNQRSQYNFLISLSFFSFSSGEIRSLDGKCYTVYVITKLIQSMS